LSQRLLRENAQHLQDTDIQTPDEIRTRNLRKRAATDLRLRPPGYRDGLYIVLLFQIYILEIILTRCL